MTPAIMGIKELQRNLSRVADAAVRGESFIIVRGSKPVFRIEPVSPPVFAEVSSGPQKEDSQPHATSRRKKV